jgi:hypothetical protein
MHRFLPLVALPLLATACRWDEGLEINNMTGTVVVPMEAATKTFNLEDGPITVTDVRNIGPVLLGFYPDVLPENTVKSYPHPEVGPLFDPGLVIGDAYPYGGTTIGTFRSACVKDMTCQVVSGRHVDFDAMVSWYNDVLGTPIEDYNENPITSGEYLRELCYNLYEYTSDAELRLTATEDRNDDGALDEGDLDFVVREDGNFEANFIVWQQEYFQNDDGQGFTAWAFMESPVTGDEFGFCNEGLGGQLTQYNEIINAGTIQRDILNRPSLHLKGGDWVSGVQPEGGDYGYVYQSAGDTPELWINFQIE